MKIIELAKEAGLQLNVYAEAYPVIAQQLERFAALVREERDSMWLAQMEFNEKRVRAKALAEHPMDYDQGFVDGVEAQLAEPVKHEVHQEPVGEMIDKNGYKGAAWYCEPPITGTKLYAAPVDMPQAEPTSVDAKAIRAEALEEAAKVCEARYNSPDFSDAVIDCADAIRNLK